MSEFGEAQRNGPSPVETMPGPIPCDYMDVSSVTSDQRRFLLQPHLSGGAVATPPLLLEVEGARALWRHLGQMLEAHV